MKEIIGLAVLVISWCSCNPNPKIHYSLLAISVY